MSRRAVIWMSALLAGVALAFAVWRAVRLAWLADDSFISFHYAWNLGHGHGLVYNAGEYVEGYTNLLYIAMRETPARVAAQAFGREPVRAMFEGGGPLAVNADKDVPLVVGAAQEAGGPARGAPGLGPAEPGCVGEGFLAE